MILGNNETNNNNYNAVRNFKSDDEAEESFWGLN